MNSSNKLAVPATLCIAVLGACVAVAHSQAPAKSDRQPTFPSTEKSRTEVVHNLSGSFAPIKRVEEFPEVVRNVYLNGNGVGSGMANPDEKYNAADVVDLKLPGRRLVAGGQRESVVFVHYEKGGYARSMVLDILQIDAAGKLQGVWQGFCRDYKKPATSIEEIRELVSSGECVDKNAVGKTWKK